MLLAVGAQDHVRRLRVEIGHQAADLGSVAHVRAGFVVEAVEVVGKERCLVAAAVEQAMAAEQAVIHGPEPSRRRRQGPHLG